MRKIITNIRRHCILCCSQHRDHKYGFVACD